MSVFPKVLSFSKTNLGKFTIGTTLVASGLVVILPFYDVGTSVGGLQRFSRSLYVGTKISLDYWWTLKVNLRNYSEDASCYVQQMSLCHQRAANRICDAAIRNGGVYVKLGQGLCTLNQLLPKEYVETLRRLENQALAYKSNDINVLFQEEFHCSPLDMFDAFNFTPVAAASLALVFQATTKEGQKVAVKSTHERSDNSLIPQAQYLDLTKRFEGDIWCLKVLLKIVEKIHPDFGFSWVLDELKGTLANELDFEKEAHNSEKCKKDLQEFSFITVPKVHWDKTSKRIMTADWYDGCKVNDVSKILQLGLQPSDVVRKLILVSGRQIFSTGFIHADPHPGNVLVMPSPQNPKSAQLIVLDHGLYETLSSSEMNSLCFLWKAIIEKNDNHMRTYANKLGIPNKDYLIFCEILAMRPIQMDLLFNISAAMTLKERQYVLNQAANHFDKIMECLKRMPKSMLLVFRQENLNTVRSINQTFGSPVDRFYLLAKCAIHGICRCDGNAALTTKIKMKLQIFRFTFWLNVHRVKIWILTSFLKTLQKFGGDPQLSSFVRDLES